jgi:transposase
VVIYEAGRMGYWLYRRLKKHDICCVVIDPGSIPKKRHGEPKTDRLDARGIARLSRANLLVAVSVPDEETEGIRELLRTYKALSKARVTAKNRITSMLARYNCKCTESKTSFTLSYRQWLTHRVKLPTSDAQLALEIAYAHLVHTEAQQKRLNEALEQVVERSRYSTVCGMLMMLHGIGPHTALGFVTSLQTPHRFSSARRCMSYYGLAPDVRQSDGKVQRGARITRRGDQLTRWLLIQSSWSYARGIRSSKKKREERARLPVWLQERMEQMEKRLQRRFGHLHRRKFKPVQKVVCAIAREMSGWLWSILKELDEQKLVSFAPEENLFPRQVA